MSQVRSELKLADLRKPRIELQFELELHLLKSKQLKSKQI